MKNKRNVWNKIYFCGVFRLNHGECKLFHFFGEFRDESAALSVWGFHVIVSSTNYPSPCSAGKKRKWDIHSYPAIQHCSVLSFVLLVFLTRTQKRATDMQRNHAGMNFGINYLWLEETIPKALNPKCGGTKNWKFKALSIDRFSSGTEAFRNHKLARWREWRRQMSLLCGRELIEGFSRWASTWQNMKLIR